MCVPVPVYVSESVSVFMFVCVVHVMNGGDDGMRPATTQIHVVNDSTLTMICLQDMVYISDVKMSRRYVEYFIRQIGKFETLNQNIARKALASGAGVSAGPGR